jgi:AraC family L-rhamnose operon regulatory protein RhaS
MIVRRQQRIVFGDGQADGRCLVPEIQELGWGKFDVADPYHLKPHRHPQAFEICLILSGEVEWEAGGQNHLLRAGDVFVTQPGELHAGRDSAMQPCSLYWIKLAADIDRRYWQKFDREAVVRLRSRMRSLPRRLRGGDAAMRPLLEMLFEEHRRDRLDGYGEALSVAAAEAILRHFLIEIFRSADRADSGDPADCLPGAVQHAIELIRRSDQCLSNCQISATVRERPNRLNQLFVNHLGMTITQFSVRERIRLARSSLRLTGKSVTEIANELGFCSSQHFATTFKRLTGMRPSDYRGGKAAPREPSAASPKADTVPVLVPNHEPSFWR